MYCKNCGNAINDTSLLCNHCGRPIEKDTIAENRKKNIAGLILGVFAGLMVMAAIMLAVFGLGSDPSRGDQTAPTVQASNNTNGDGTYKVGTDIEAGEYYIYCTNSLSCYFEVSSDSSGQLTSIVTNDNIDTFAFVTVKTGQYLKINGGKFVKAADASVPGADANGNYGAGMYRVGVDIPAGEYKVTCTNSIGCYIEVSKDSSGSLYSIVSNENIDTFSYITVNEGQYLTVVHGQFAPAE